MSRAASIRPDAWAALRARSGARIALGRAGGSLPTRALLEFQAAHALARDAVHTAFDPPTIEASLAPLGLGPVRISSAARDRPSYLQRPELGRRLDDPSRTRLRTLAAPGGVDVALIVSDGLSATAAHAHAAALITELVPLLSVEGVTFGPICIVSFGRVAIEDDIGEILGARLALILLGERPGLASADSLGAYLVYDPRPGRTDAERNCVSNIRPAGLPVAAAAATLHYLITEARRRALSGVALKDERHAAEGSLEAATAERA